MKHKIAPLAALAAVLAAGLLLSGCGSRMLTLVNVVRFMIQGMGFSAFAILAGVMEMFARSAAGLLLVPVLGFPGAALGGPLAWVFADAFLVPAYFKCRRTLMSRAHHVNIAKKGA